MSQFYATCSVLTAGAPTHERLFFQLIVVSVFVIEARLFCSFTFVIKEQLRLSLPCSFEPCDVAVTRTMLATHVTTEVVGDLSRFE